MKIASVNDLGRAGYIADQEPHRIPMNAWSDMQNIRCVDGSIKSFDGHVKIDDISIRPQTINFAKSGAATNIVYAEDSVIKAYTAGTETEIGSGFSGGGFWDSCVFGGVAVLNNGLDNPQYWGGEGSVVDLPYDSTVEGQVCTWSDVGMRAQVIRPFRSVLVALDVEDCDGRNRRKVHYSHLTDPGSVPITWDPTNDEYLAGFTELKETPGRIIDGRVLRDSFLIYKEDAIYAMTFTGDQYIYNFRMITDSYGLYARNCVTGIGGRHFFVGDGDIYITDGVNFQSIADERIKDLFFNDVSRAFRQRTYCTYYHRTGEVWLCYPSANSQHCNKALVWDSKSQGDPWSQRNIPEADCAIFTIVDAPSSYGWGTQAQLDALGTGKIALPYATWADWGTNPSSPSWTTWGELVDSSSVQDFMVLGANQQLIQMDNGNTADGTPLECYARRTDLEIDTKTGWNLVVRFYPLAEGDPFAVRLGFQDQVGGSVTWTDYQTFDPATDYQLDFTVNGRLHAVEFYSNADVSWKLSGYEFGYEKMGEL